MVNRQSRHEVVVLFSLITAFGITICVGTLVGLLVLFAAGPQEPRCRKLTSTALTQNDQRVLIVSFPNNTQPNPAKLEVTYESFIRTFPVKNITEWDYRVDMSVMGEPRIIFVVPPDFRLLYPGWDEDYRWTVNYCK